MSEQKSPDDFSFISFFVPFTRRKAVWCVIIIGLIVYFNALFNSFVWDDLGYVILNTNLHTFNLSYLFGPNTFNKISFYRPLTATYFSLLYNLFATNAFPYHLFQVALHIANAVLLFYLFKKFLPILLSFVLVVLFLMHPIQVESVAYISSTINVLFFFFGILALLISMQKTLKMRQFLIISLLLFLSLLTKETAVIFVFAILLYYGIFNKKKLFLIFAYVLVPLIGYLLIRFFVGHVFFTVDTTSILPIQQLSLAQRLVSMPKIIWYYPLTLLYPARLAVDQLWIVKDLNFWNFYFPLAMDVILAGALVALGIFIYRKKRSDFFVYCYFLLLFLVSFGMIIQIFPIDMTVADRWFYLPLALFLGAVGVGIKQVTLSNPFLKKLLFVFIVIVCVIFAVRTIARNADWIDNVTLFSRDVQVESNFDIEGMLGESDAGSHQYTQAVIHLKKSVAIFPRDTTQYDLGYVYEQIGNYPLAEYYYGKVLMEDNKTSGQTQVWENTYDAMARVLTLHDTPERAEVFLEKAVVQYPDNPSYWAYLALSAYALHQQDEALAAAQKAKTLLPNATTEKLYSRIKNKQVINLRE